VLHFTSRNAPAASVPRSAPATLNPEPSSYEAALAELEALVRALESQQLPLDQLLSSHQRGAALLAWCRAKLQAVEQQVQVFEESQDGGQLRPLLG
jgi:exodeoxyribonuclease VII small subunit